MIDKVQHKREREADQQAEADREFHQQTDVRIHGRCAGRDRFDDRHIDELHGVVHPGFFELSRVLIERSLHGCALMLEVAQARRLHFEFGHPRAYRLFLRANRQLASGQRVEISSMKFFGVSMRSFIAVLPSVAGR